MTTIYHCWAIVFAGEGKSIGRNQIGSKMFKCEPYEKTYQRCKDEIIRWQLGELVGEPQLVLKFPELAEYNLIFAIIPEPGFKHHIEHSGYTDIHVGSCLTEFSWKKPRKDKNGHWNNILEVVVGRVEII